MATPAAAERVVMVVVVCPLCGRIFRRAGRLCKPCATRCEKQEQVEQERDYLARWLSTRDDDLSILAERLRAKARALGVDWLHPPAPLLFKDRMEQVMGTLILGRVRGNAGSGVAVEPGVAKFYPLIAQEAL